MDLFLWLFGCLLAFLWSSTVKGEEGGKFDSFSPASRGVNCKRTRIVRFFLKRITHSFSIHFHEEKSNFEINKIAQIVKTIIRESSRS